MLLHRLLWYATSAHHPTDTIALTDRTSLDAGEFLGLILQYVLRETFWTRGEVADGNSKRSPAGGVPSSETATAQKAGPVVIKRLAPPKAG